MTNFLSVAYSNEVRKKRQQQQKQQWVLAICQNPPNSNARTKKKQNSERKEQKKLRAKCLARLCECFSLLFAFFFSLKLFFSSLLLRRTGRRRSADQTTTSIALCIVGYATGESIHSLVSQSSQFIFRFQKQCVSFSVCVCVFFSFVLIFFHWKQNSIYSWEQSQQPRQSWEKGKRWRKWGRKKTQNTTAQRQTTQYIKNIRSLSHSLARSLFLHFASTVKHFMCFCLCVCVFMCSNGMTWIISTHTQHLKKTDNNSYFANGQKDTQRCLSVNVREGDRDR